MNDKALVVQYTRSTLSERAKYAGTIARAGELVPSGFRDSNGAPNAAKVLLAFEMGAMLGLAPIASLQSINVIEGKASISPQLMLALFRRAGHKVSIEKKGTLEGGDFAAVVTLTRTDGQVYSATWTPHDAVRAGLADSYAPDPVTGLWVVLAKKGKYNNPTPWEKYPKNMLVWRAVSEVGREGASEELMGLIYTPEELGASGDIDEDGNWQQGAPVTKDDEDALIAEFKDLDDRKDLVLVWQSHHTIGVADDAWTARVQAEFDTKAAQTTNDSRKPPEQPAPGGDTPADSEPVNGETVGEEDQTPQHNDEDVQDAEEVPAEGSPTHVEVDGVVVAETRHVDAPDPYEGMSAEERFDAQEAAKEAAWLAEHSSKEPAKKAAAKAFDSSALQ
jgi:hypothetical protein